MSLGWVFINTTPLCLEAFEIILSGLFSCMGSGWGDWHVCVGGWLLVGTGSGLDDWHVLVSGRLAALGDSSAIAEIQKCCIGCGTGSSRQRFKGNSYNGSSIRVEQEFSQITRADKGGSGRARITWSRWEIETGETIAKIQERRQTEDWQKVQKKS